MPSGELFPVRESAAAEVPPPLAERMRPRTFEDLLGQEELLAPGRPLREAIEQIDVDALSPREALDTLYALQTTARETDA